MRQRSEVATTDCGVSDGTAQLGNRESDVRYGDIEGRQGQRCDTEQAIFVPHYAHRDNDLGLSHMCTDWRLGLDHRQN